jgi:GGDEF domain-containing protein
MSMAWMAVTLSATNYLDPGPTRVLPPALQAATTTIGLWRPIPYAGFFAAVIGSIVYVIAGVLSRFGASGISAADLPATQQAAVGALLTAAPGFATVFLALIGSGWLAESLAARTERDELQRRQDRQLIEDLIPVHGETGLMKWSYAEREMSDEVVRARRYNQPLSFALLSPPGAPGDESDRDPEDLALELKPLADLARGLMRPTDVVALYRTGALALVMPHTSLKGAQIALEKVHVEAAKAGFGNVIAGLAEFPQDGADVQELCTEAEHALAFARESGLAAVSRSLLQ